MMRYAPFSEGRAAGAGVTPMNAGSDPAWKAIAVLIGRIVFAALFLMGAGFKFAGIGATAGYIASAGFPFPLFLTWCAAIFELLLVLAFLSGAFFSEAALLAALYVVFLAFAFHGPSHWGSDQLGQLEFGGFMIHFSFAAGLLFEAAHGPGRWALRRSLIWNAPGRR
jgi:uncharacterized membrane protein YphA (DoxX/SURF4 family)